MNKVIVILKSSILTSIFLAVLFGLAFAIDGLAATGSNSCNANSANRQLDYWLGKWKIGSAGSRGDAHSVVTLSLDKCLVVENWDDGGGHRGRNVFGYSADDKSWYGLFADNEGRVHVFTSGKVEGGKAEFEGTSRGPRGKILNRVKVVRLNAQKTEQTWEKSSDNGATWTFVFRGEYSRATP